MQKLKLSRNLRRDILRGHPWIYQNALQNQPNQAGELALLLDQKSEPLGWVITDPGADISARILSLGKRAPDEDFIYEKLLLAQNRRSHFNLSQTNAFRFINGEGDHLPGLVIDIYANTAVIQFDGQNLSSFWTQFPFDKWIKGLLPQVENIVIKPRGDNNLKVLVSASGFTGDQKVKVLEHNAQFQVDIQQGQKTGFFLDQRENRLYVRSISNSKSVLNLFSYTGGFSINAGLGGATEVTSVDISEGSLKESQNNWEFNSLEKVPYKCIAVDIYDFLPRLKNRYDMIIVDPPSMAPSEKAKPQAIKKYTELFAEAAKKTKPQGDLILSSCSSHISFNDFFSIITECLSLARRRGQIFRISGQGEDHPFLHIHHEMRYLKFVHLSLD